MNATIERYANVVLKINDEPVVRFVASDQQIEVTSSVDEALALDGKLDLHKAVYKQMMQRYNNGKRLPIELTTFCDAPAGSGLGSSSTLVVAMIKVFVELLNAPIDEYAIAQLAFNIERVECGLQGGRQDQYSAAFGGFNFMEFYAEERTNINPLRIKNWIICELESSLVLFSTGISRESARIIADQSNNVKQGAVNTIQAMHGIKREALVMRESLLRGDFKRLVQSMCLGWENKKSSAKTVSNPYIDKIYDAAITAGALAGRVSGAGGGGFMLFFVPAEKRMAVIRELNKFEGQVSNCHFTKHGCQAWRV
jgi:D-glycero-alpha-D-manno-heptose-7-phosphate kinase